jgi:hypothetical protein
MPQETPRALTAEEVRKKLYEQMRSYAHYWAHPSAGRDLTVEQKMESLCFSILGIFDGIVPGLPAMDLVLMPHSNDKAFRLKQGENWFEPGMKLNVNLMMHDEFYADERASNEAKQKK